MRKYHLKGTEVAPQVSKKPPPAYILVIQNNELMGRAEPCFYPQAEKVLVGKRYVLCIFHFHIFLKQYTICQLAGTTIPMPNFKNT